MKLIVTKAQRKALHEIYRKWYDRDPLDQAILQHEHNAPTYRQFRRSISWMIPASEGVVMVQVHYPDGTGMWYGIETDGYAHT